MKRGGSFWSSEAVDSYAMSEFRDPTTQRIGAFLEDIGLSVRHAELTQPTFLPGLQIEPGGLIVDEQRLLYPGDLLHEAGHLAMLTTEQRQSQGPDAGPDLGYEIGAMCWSYAAALHIGIDPAVVFHAQGYRGASQSFLENFAQGRYPGLPLLQWMGLTADEKNAPELGVQPFPHMLRWLRE
jgi:hypothetical protein